MVWKINSPTGKESGKVNIFSKCSRIVESCNSRSQLCTAKVFISLANKYLIPQQEELLEKLWLAKIEEVEDENINTISND